MIEQKANYRMVGNTPELIILQDVGPWDRYMTITNAAEILVAEIEEVYGIGNRQLLYYDSDDELTELLVKDGRFAGFAPVPK